MTSKMKKIWSAVGITGLIVLVLAGNLIYMNLRAPDPILPGWEEYDPARFELLMASDEPVLVEIYASWCPTCLLQHRAFEALHQEGRAPAIRAIRVDFDRDHDFVKARGFQGTGLLVIFRNGKEVAREGGLVTGDRILAFLKANGIS